MSQALALAISLVPASVYAGVLDQWQAHIDEASKRFAIPAGWIRAVITAESGGNPAAVSSRGAMGLMQLMPETWNAVRAAHHLGPDPFDPRANILAGAAYLKAMHERFGFPGLFAAYHAGPSRYEQHLRSGKPLPAQTRTYLRTLAEMLPEASGRLPTLSGRELFFPLRTVSTPAGRTAAAASELFVPLTGATRLGER
jgi:soluble lytic murein transglycosylase-like protein